MNKDETVPVTKKYIYFFLFRKNRKLMKIEKLIKF